MNNHLFSKKLKKNLSLFRVTNSVNYSFWIFTLIGLFVFVGCNTNKIAKTNDTAKQLVIYPAPPEPARIQFLTKITSSADLGKKQSFLSKLILGQEKSKAMVKPYGISIHKGKLYVCDQYGGGLEIIDL